EALENQVKLARLRLELSEVKAPSDGQILRVAASPGEALGPGYPLLEMADVTAMHVVAEVYENDVWGVRLGQAASITSTAFPKTAQGATVKLTGKVVEIGRSIAKNEIMSLNPAADADLRVYSVRILLDDAPLALQPAAVLLPVAGKTPAKVTQPELASRMINLQVLVEFAK
ncbi:MAG TPA: efflux RND transporter periplasmic adaptor subunit, partial [Pirellulales bacterium]